MYRRLELSMPKQEQRAGDSSRKLPLLVWHRLFLLTNCLRRSSFRLQLSVYPPCEIIFWLGTYLEIQLLLPLGSRSRTKSDKRSLLKTFSARNLLIGIFSGQQTRILILADDTTTRLQFISFLESKSSHAAAGGLGLRHTA